MKTRTFISGVLAVVIAICVAFLYGRGVLARSWILDHNAFEIFTSPDGRYRLEYGLTSPDFNWMRLYRQGDNEVIADRRFWGEVPYRINWNVDSVHVASSDESAISLPPHWWERWTAKLP
ncbi:hypothetical protein [Variovorax sp. OV329]|uniref:hypothetical protein n=1 Tax=Variovorax sp. OV329 TaxID=1882825 RepID=UPI0008E6880A|nr:hypothetical protein [Variovorax sp. OV329]SFN10829.1 hypothetical protein SAMN05444747_11559 [Variovorax sp. OV329]